MIKLTIDGKTAELDQETGEWGGDSLMARYLNLAVPAFLYPPSPSDGIHRRAPQALAGKAKLSGSEIVWPDVKADNVPDRVY